MFVVTFSYLDFVLSLRGRELRTSSWCPEVGLGILNLTSGHLGSFDETLNLLVCFSRCGCGCGFRGDLEMPYRLAFL